MCGLPIWPYESPEPLGFRGSPTFIGEIDYLSDKDAWIDRVRILSLDEDRLPSLLENDANAAGDRLEAILVDGPQHGELVLNADGTFVYTPLAGLAASDAFTYRATNGTWVSNLATVTINNESRAPADLTGNGFVDFQDLTILLAAWTGLGGAAAPQAAIASVTTESRAVRDVQFERLGRRERATWRRADRSFNLSSHASPLRRLQAAAVDRAMSEGLAAERAMIAGRRSRSGGRR